MLAAATAASAACGGRRDAMVPADAAATQTREPFEFRAATRVMESFPVQLQSVLTITNRSAASTSVFFPDGCVVLISVYRPDSPEPVWEQARSVGCTMAIVQTDIGPGQSTEFSSRTSAAEILGDSLPDGRYHLRVHSRPDGRPLQLHAGTVDLAVPRN
jgi:hypothetical protein